jgi:hypothetical protein
MRDVARFPENDRRDLFRAAAQKMRVHEAIIEKDFWVCWVQNAPFGKKQPSCIRKPIGDRRSLCPDTTRDTTTICTG